MLEDLRIVFQGDDGQVRVMIPANNVYLLDGQFVTYGKGEAIPTAARPATVEEIAAKDVPAGKKYKIVKKTEIPTDRWFRDAWEFDGKKVEPNLEKAKELQKNHWREARRPLLEALNIEHRKAAGNAQKQAEIDATAQALRDVTKTDLSSVKTVEELKSVWPEILGPKP